MATTPTVAQRGHIDPNDPFFYGWRNVRRVNADGTVVWDQIPLTREDVLYPQEGDHVSQNTAHATHARYLVSVCLLCLAGDPTAVVLGDTGIRWDVPELPKPHAPDVAVIVGVRARARRQWPTFPVAAEGVRPKLIIEVTSPSTVEDDLTTKVVEYAQAQVEQYVIVDGVTNGPDGPVRLLDYRLVGEAYVEQALDARGWVWLDAVKVWLGVVHGEPVCFDETGQPIGDYTTMAARAVAEAAARAKAEARVQTEAAARAEAEAQVRALKEELRGLRGG